MKILRSDGVDPKFQHPDGSGPNNYFLGLCSMCYCIDVAGRLWSSHALILLSLSTLKLGDSIWIE